jgi:hypothetical protein
MTNTESMAIQWEQALREAKKSDAEVSGAIESIRRRGDTVTVTFRSRKEAKRLDKTNDLEHHRDTARPGAAPKDNDMPTKKNTKPATKKTTTKRKTSKKVAAGKSPRVAKKITAKKRPAKRTAKKTTAEG